MYEWVHINEIRAAFSDYDPKRSPLRSEKSIPMPTTKIDVFLEMMFHERRDWKIIDQTYKDRVFESRWMIEGIKNT